MKEETNYVKRTQWAYTLTFKLNVVREVELGELRYSFFNNNPVYWADPSGLYEINSTDTQTNIILNESEMEAYQAMVDSGSLDGLSGQDLVDAIVGGLDAAGFTNDYTLGEATITGSAKSGSSGAELQVFQYLTLKDLIHEIY